MNTGIVCDECRRPHPQMIEVKATAIFLNRKNEWITYFCPSCLRKEVQNAKEKGGQKSRSR